METSILETAVLKAENLEILTEVPATTPELMESAAPEIKTKEPGCRRKGKNQNRKNQNRKRKKYPLEKF